jgi:hypothetical protein
MITKSGFIFHPLNRSFGFVLSGVDTNQLCAILKVFLLVVPKFELVVEQVNPGHSPTIALLGSEDKNQ